MKKFTTTLLVLVAFIVLSVVGGWYLACLIMLLPYNMPGSLDRLIRFGLSLTGNDHLANADDMPMLALLLFWIVATIFTAGLICFCNGAIRRYRSNHGRHAVEGSGKRTG
jgi:hypothetical protein